MLSTIEKSDAELLEEFMLPKAEAPKLLITSAFDLPIPDLPVSSAFNTFMQPFQVRVLDDDVFSDMISNHSHSGNFLNSFAHTQQSQFAVPNLLSPYSVTQAVSPLLSPVYHNQASVSPLHQPLLPPIFLSVPQRRSGRSPSVTSQSSFSSLGMDNFETDADWGETSAFPGSQIVQVPSPWINAINSPTRTVSDLGSPYQNYDSLDTLFPTAEITYVPFDDYVGSMNYAGSEFSQVDDAARSMNDFDGLGISTQYATPDTQQSSAQINMEASISDTLIETAEVKVPVKTEIIRKGIEPEEDFPTTVPNGRFWNVVKANGKTLYQCPIPHCEKTFTRPYNLKSHYRFHTGERPYICSDAGCKSTFTRKHDLKRHMKLHSGSKDFRCGSCGRSFSRSDALGRHLKIENGRDNACAIRLDENGELREDED